MELAASMLSAEISRLLKKELENYFRHHNIEEIYWTESQVVLGYIRTNAKIFKFYISNLVQLIRDHLDMDQWKYLSTAENLKILQLEA